MLRPDQVKASLINKAKSLAPALIEIPVDEVREAQWQGTDFTYPNTRLRLSDFSPDITCEKATIAFIWYVYSELSSSLECDRIAGKIAQEFRNKRFSDLNQNLRFIFLDIQSVIPAIRQDRRTWRSEVRVRGQVESLP